MSKVSVAAAAGDRVALHPEAAVAALDNVQCRYRQPEARPAGSGIELGLRVIQRGIATDAAVQPRGMIFVVFPAECIFGSCLAGYPVSSDGQQRPPLGVA